MSYMSIDLNSLKDIEKRVGALSKSLEQIKSSLSSVRSNIDSTVRNRSGIDSSMSSLIREVGERERIMNNVKQFLKEAVKQYEDMEKALKGESDRIIANSAPKTGIIKSILNGLKSIGKKLGNLLKTIAKNSILLSPVIVGTPVVIIGKILAERGFIVTNEPTEIIKKNDKGIPILEGILSYSPFEFNPYVVLLQKRLIELGYGDGIKVNGRLDSKTLKAVNKYKEDYGLWNFGEYEGKVGETTWNHMFNNEKVPYIGDFEPTDDLISDDVPPLSGILSYNPNVYSEEVLMMQRRLNEIFAGVIEYKKIKEDGYFGPETLEAVNRYKEYYELWNHGEYKGVVGETTWRHMFNSEILREISHAENRAPGGLADMTTAVARQKIVDEAKYWIGKGVKYQFGSPHYNNEDPIKRLLDHDNPPPSLDCSDFTAGVYATALGISFDDYTGSQLKVGTAVDITKAKTGDFSDLQPGDIIIFSWNKQAPNPNGDHAAIYVGDGKFVHCSSSANGIVEKDLSEYWNNYGYVFSNIFGIRRIIQDNDTYVNNPGEGQKPL